MVCAGATSVTIAHLYPSGTLRRDAAHCMPEVEKRSVGAVSDGEKLSSHYYVMSCSAEGTESTSVMGLKRSRIARSPDFKCT